MDRPHIGFTVGAFQFLDRNSFGSDLTFITRTVPWLKFQFLDRNSFGSDEALRGLGIEEANGFNSSIGILSVRTRAVIGVNPQKVGVSIPRSEFFRFGHNHIVRTAQQLRSFNSSIGILSVRTLRAQGLA